MLPRLTPALALLLALAGPAAQAQTAAAPAAAAASAPTLRAEVAKPLQAAQEAIKAGRYADALARVAEAEAVPNLSAYEAFIALRVKAPVAFGNGDAAGALAQFEQVLDSPLLPAADRPALTETVIKLALQQKDYPRAGRWLKRYIADGGGNAELLRVHPQVLSVLGDHAGVVAWLTPRLQAEAAAGRAPAEDALRLLAASQGALKDMAGYTATLQQLAASTGKPDYWQELVARTVRREGFAEERWRLDVYRLRRALGLALNAAELGDMAWRANQAGLPAEAQALLDEGFGSGLLGKDANADADRKLREAATKAAAQDRAGAAEGEAAALKAKDGNAAQGLGLALSGAGEHARALKLLAAAQDKGGLRRPDEARLHLAVAQWRAGQADAARRSLAQVQGGDGAADLARLWTLFLDSPARR